MSSSPLSPSTGLSAGGGEAHDPARALPPFAALRAFEVVGRVGGIRRAGQALGIDHTVVSRHLRALEDWLGIALVDRAGGRLMLSEAGHAYHVRVSAALHDLVAATRDAMAAGTGAGLRLWAVPGLSAQWLSDQLADFERSDPGFAVELRPTDTCAQLAQFEADADIRFYGDDWPPHPGGPGLQALELARPPLMIVASPALAATLRLETPEDLLSAPLLHEEHHEQWRAWLTRNGVALDRPLAGPLLWHAHLAIAAARQGRGLALANRYLVWRDLAEGALVELAVPGTHQVMIGSYWFVARADRWSDPAIARLRTFLRTRAGLNPIG
jgi:DNA-binding transcriptional LysR family regulator